MIYYDYYYYYFDILILLLQLHYFESITITITEPSITITITITFLLHTYYLEQLRVVGACCLEQLTRAVQDKLDSLSSSCEPFTP